MLGSLFALVAFLPITGAVLADQTEADLGPVTVGEYKGQVLFTYPADGGKGYRIDVVVSKPENTPAIRAERIDIWLLARNGKAVPVMERPNAGPLVESSLGKGASADGMFVFASSVAYSELSGVVVSVDGNFTTFKLPARDQKKSDKP
jgi:hypothetical protein